MELSSYPMDTQRCQFNLESYAYDRDRMRIVWHQVPFIKANNHLPIYNYDLQNVFAENQTKVYPRSTNRIERYDSPSLYFVIRRALSYYVYKVYIPMILLVVFNIGSYWIPQSAIPARMTLIVTTFLSSVVMLQAVSSEHIQTPTTTSLQIFVTFSIGMYFGSLFYLFNRLFPSHQKRFTTGWVIIQKSVIMISSTYFGNIGKWNASWIKKLIIIRIRMKAWYRMFISFLPYFELPQNGGVDYIKPTILILYRNCCWLVVPSC